MTPCVLVKVFLFLEDPSTAIFRLDLNLNTRRYPEFCSVIIKHVMHFIYLLKWYSNVVTEILNVLVVKKY